MTKKKKNPSGWVSSKECPYGPHRGPQGPNEDLLACLYCFSASHMMRPEGESYGWHIEDCCLSMRHSGSCMGGGSGHRVPEDEIIRGY